MTTRQPSTDPQVIAAWDRHRAAASAMQAGVHAELQLGSETSFSPKHLRVGVNAAMVDTAAIQRLLVDKGLLTELELATAMADAMQAEVERYQTHLATLTGRPVVLTPGTATFADPTPQGSA